MVVFQFNMERQKFENKYFINKIFTIFFYFFKMKDKIFKRLFPSFEAPFRSFPRQISSLGRAKILPAMNYSNNCLLEHTPSVDVAWLIFNELYAENCWMLPVLKAEWAANLLNIQIT